MPTYAYPGWRRIIFGSVLVVLVVVSMAPSVSQGTVAVSWYGVAPRGVVNHVFVGFSKIELHEAGFPDTSGWTVISKKFSNVDLVSSPGQSLPQQISFSSVHSARYESIRITFSNATIVYGGRSTSVAAPLPVRENVTLIVPPNSIGDVLFVVSFDYLSLVGQPPSLNLRIVQVQSV